MNEQIYILILLFIVAFFYSSVGHGGASGYIAVLSIIGISSLLIKPSVLLLNIFVAGISFFHYYRNGHFRWKLFYPFAILSIPMAYLGSFIIISPTLYKQILGICLIVAVLRILGLFNPNHISPAKPLPIWAGVVIGAFLGLFSGMIGIGGGIILSPLILLFNWGNLKETAAVSALFIVVNSIAGILGLWKQEITFHPQLFMWLMVAVAGGIIGSYWGSRRAENKTLKNVLAIVLLFAAVKLIFI
ncbi:MAG: sulfite exporter TauE/SafE family protein [Bacteroidota bacterium]